MLHTAPSVNQYLLSRREQAVAQARVFAKRQHVRAWVTMVLDACSEGGPQTRTAFREGFVTRGSDRVRFMESAEWSG